LILTIRLIIIAILPTIAIAVALYLRDKYDREPLYLLVKIFLLGALSAIPTAFVEKILMTINIFGGLLSITFTSFIIAGLTEEYFKRYVVLKYAYYSKHFNEKLDGLIYSSFSALGFATVENILYVVFRFTANPYVGIYRGIISVPAHVLFGVTMGYYLSLARFSNNVQLKNLYLQKSLYIPVFLHGFFDFILMSRINVLMYLFVPYVLYLWITNLKKLNQYTKESEKAHQIEQPEE